MDIEQIRADVAGKKKALRITTHAQIEAAKDGLLLADLKNVFDHGRVIEQYPADKRALLYAKTEAGQLPVHVVVETDEDEVVIVTAYIPDPAMWIGNVRRRRQG